MPTLTIQLLGQFQLCYDHQPITAITKRGQTLLTYLLLYRQQAHRREGIAFLLWPETHDGQARTNLRTELTRLRRTFGEFDRYVQDEHGLLQWRPDAPFTLDVMAFEQAIQRAEQAKQKGDDAAALLGFQVAIAQYTGDLLTNVYADWVITARQRLGEKFVGALQETIILLQANRDYAQALRYARQLLRYDPLHETTYRQLMEIYAQTGDHANMKRVYETCRLILRRELDVEPSPLTRQRYQMLMNEV